MFINRLMEKPRKKLQRYRLRQRLPIQTAGALLVGNQYKFYMEQVRRLSGLPLIPDEHFEHFYLVFMHRFAEFVQVLPEHRDAVLGSLLTEGLLRGLNTLQVFVTQFGNPTPLERYALFTACVLRDISHVLTQQKVFITDNEGMTIKHWQPFCGPLTEEMEGNSYKIIPISSALDRLGKEVRTLLARQVMGENGFLSIASDPRLLMEWIEALEEQDEEGTGRLVHAIKLYRRDGGGLLDHLPLAHIDTYDSPATEHADVFFDWLIDGLEDGSIKMNSADAHVHNTEVGLFVETPGIFKQFADLYNVPVNHYILFTQIGNLLGVPQQGGEDHHYAQLFGRPTKLLSEYPPEANGIKNNFLLGKKQTVSREGMMLDADCLFIHKKAPEVTPYIQIPPAMRQAHQALAEYNAVMKPNLTLRNR